MRLFVAIALPDAVKDALAGVIERLRPSATGEKWVPTQNLHATIAFLGEVRDARVPSLEAALRDAVAGLPATDSHTDGAGAFPSPRRARVLWAGLADEAGHLAESAAACAAALEPLGFAREDRAWTPHVTLARFRSPRDVSALIAEAAVPPERFVVNAVTLFRSRLARPAPIYEQVARIPFAR